MQKTTKPKPINWIAVRAEYEAGGVTYQQLADRLGISLRTVIRRAKKESWSKGTRDIQREMSQEVSQQVKAQIVQNRVEKRLSDLEIIDAVIASTYTAIASFPDSFKTSGEAIAALDKMLKIKLEYSDERIQKWLLDKGYVAVPIAEFAPQIEMGESETEAKE